MGFRFRRTIKILPGVQLNIGKKGMSVSIGPRGAKITIGKTGTRTTVGLPGTGLSYTNHQSRRTVRASQVPKRKSLVPKLLMIAIVAIVLSAFFGS